VSILYFFQHLLGGLDEWMTANPTLYPGRALVLPYPVGIAILRVETIKRHEGQEGVKKKISKHSSHQASGIRLQYGLYILLLSEKRNRFEFARTTSYGFGYLGGNIQAAVFRAGSGRQRGLAGRRTDSHGDFLFLKKP
jgi:hypothetical protein